MVVDVTQKGVYSSYTLTKVILRPEATYSGEKIPDRQTIEKIHLRAHDLCFIANSVRTEVVTEVRS